MKKILLLIAITITSCAPKAKFTMHDEQKILVGKGTQKDLQQEPFNEWFTQSYNDYTLTEEIKSEIQKNIKDYTIIIFMGTWCEDSQNQVPKFYKILEEVNFPSKKQP